MACCFCCCPMYRCTLWFCGIELLLCSLLWFNSFNDLFCNVHNTVGLKEVFLLVVLSGWLVTLCVSTASLVQSQRKKDPQLVLPRLVQLSGYLVIEFAFALLLVIYFTGAHQSINSVLISFHEKVFSDPLDYEQRQEAQDILKMYFAGLIFLDFVLICYSAFALCAVKKHYRQLQSQTWTFQAISQNDSTRGPQFRQPPMNPHYKGSIS